MEIGTPAVRGAAMRPFRWRVVVIAVLALVGTLGAAGGDVAGWYAGLVFATILLVPLLARDLRSFRILCLWVGWLTLAVGAFMALLALFTWIMPPTLLLVVAAQATRETTGHLSVWGRMAVAAAVLGGFMWVVGVSVFFDH